MKNENVKCESEYHTLVLKHFKNIYKDENFQVHTSDGHTDRRTDKQKLSALYLKLLKID